MNTLACAAPAKQVKIGGSCHALTSPRCTLEPVTTSTTEAAPDAVAAPATEASAQATATPVQQAPVVEVEAGSRTLGALFPTDAGDNDPASQLAPTAEPGGELVPSLPVETQPPAKQEPAPLRSVEPPPRSIEELLGRVNELEGELRQLTDARRSQAEAMRHQLLVDQWGLRPNYLAYAPGVADADPATEEGKAALATWRTAHPELFTKAAPKMDTVAEAATEQAPRLMRQRGADGWRGLFKR